MFTLAAGALVTAVERPSGIVTSSDQHMDQWAHFTDSTKTDTSSISSAESKDATWVITDDQREFYINQVKPMQPDTKGVISGMKF